MYNADTLVVSRTMTTDNVADDQGGDAEGGGLYVDDGSKKTTLNRSSITGNRAVGAHPRGGGIFFQGGGPITLIRSVIAENSPEACSPPGSVAGCAT